MYEFVEAWTYGVVRVSSMNDTGIRFIYVHNNHCTATVLSNHFFNSQPRAKRARAVEDPLESVHLRELIRASGQRMLLEICSGVGFVLMAFPGAEWAVGQALTLYIQQHTIYSILPS